MQRTAQFHLLDITEPFEKVKSRHDIDFGVFPRNPTRQQVFRHRNDNLKELGQVQSRVAPPSFGINYGSIFLGQLSGYGLRPCKEWIPEILKASFAVCGSLQKPQEIAADKQVWDAMPFSILSSKFLHRISKLVPTRRYGVWLIYPYALTIFNISSKDFSENYD